MGNCCSNDNEYDDEGRRMNKNQYLISGLQPGYVQYPGSDAPPMNYGYVPRAYPLEKDDEPLVPLQFSYQDRPPYVIDSVLSFAWSSFKPKNDHHDIPCALILNAPEQPLEQRAGVDIVCIIDVSGSMEEDNKLILVKKTLTFLISQLTAIDRLCIISFNNSATKLMPLTVMNNNGKAFASNVAQYLTPGGGTNIVDGLRFGLSVALMRNMINYTIDLLILSDGVDNNQMSSLYRARDCFASFDQYNMSYAVHAFGYGHEHDSELLGEIAHIKNGGFYYVEEAIDIQHAFSHCLGEILSVVARDVRVALVMQPSPIPFSITKVHSECGTVNFRLPNIASGTSQEAIFVLSFPPCRIAMSDCRITPIKAYVSYVMVQTGEYVNVERELSIEISTRSNIEFYKGVMLHFYRVKTAEILKFAGELGAQHRFDEAKALLDRGIHDLKKSEYHSDPLVKILIRDLDNSRHKLKDHHSWRRGGHAHFRHIHHGHWAKRGEKNDLYMNARQKDMRLQSRNYF